MVNLGLFFGYVLNGQPVVLELMSGSFPPSPPASWTQATWFIDPQNLTGLASDGNSGIDAAHPVLTYNGGVVAKWGTQSPTLRQNTTITWLSSDLTGADPVVFTPTVVQCFVKLTGVATIIHAGAFVAVTPKAHSPAQLLNVDLGFAASVGQFVQNTTVGKASKGAVYKLVGGTNFAILQPLSNAVVPFVSGSQVNTWAPGDTYQLLAFPSVYFVNVTPAVGGFDPSFDVSIQLLNLHAIEPAPLGTFSAWVYGADVNDLECLIDPLVQGVSSQQGTEPTYSYSSFFTQGVFNQDANHSFVGGGIVNQFGSVIGGGFQADIVLDNTAGLGAFQVGARSWALPPNMVGAYIGGVVEVAGSLVIGTHTLGVIWGPGTLNVVGTTRMVYGGAAGEAVAVFLQAGGLLLNNGATAYAINPIDPAAWHPGRALTPANLDALLPAPGFAGLAINPGGASISNAAAAGI